MFWTRWIYINEYRRQFALYGECEIPRQDTIFWKLTTNESAIRFRSISRLNKQQEGNADACFVTSSFSGINVTFFDNIVLHPLLTYYTPRFSEHRYRLCYANPYRVFYTLSCCFRAAFVLLWLGNAGEHRGPNRVYFERSIVIIMTLLWNQCREMFVLWSMSFLSQYSRRRVITYSWMLPKATTSRKFISFFFFLFFDDSTDSRATV